MNYPPPRPSSLSKDAPLNTEETFADMYYRMYTGPKDCLICGADVVRGSNYCPEHGPNPLRREFPSNVYRWEGSSFELTEEQYKIFITKPWWYRWYCYFMGRLPRSGL